MAHYKTGTGFWEKWEHRFEEERDVLITPSDPAVLRFVKKIDVSKLNDKEDELTRVWNEVYDRIDYKLSWEFATPETTLFVGHGDCEDLSFLMASLLPHIGYSEGEYVIGWLEGYQGDSFEHTWVEVDGRVIDATGKPKHVERWEYVPERSWKLKFDNEKLPKVT